MHGFLTVVGIFYVLSFLSSSIPCRELYSIKFTCQFVEYTCLTLFHLRPSPWLLFLVEDSQRRLEFVNEGVVEDNEGRGIRVKEGEVAGEGLVERRSAVLEQNRSFSGAECWEGSWETF